MFIAYNEKGERTSIDNINNSAHYFCPICNGELLVKNKGNKKKHHFAHKKKCTDTWTNDMSDWHIGWQRRFPEQYREVVVTHNNEKHRADVLIGQTVVEFQHSPISNEEFLERNMFYTSAGYNVVWLFDMIDVFKTRMKYIESNEQYNFEWGYHWRTFDSFEPDKEDKIFLFFQFDRLIYFKNLDPRQDYCPVYKVIKFSDNRKYFAIDNTEFYQCKDISKILSHIPRVNNMSEFENTSIGWGAFDSIHSIDKIRYPCYKNESGFEYAEKCDRCQYSSKYNDYLYSLDSGSSWHFENGIFEEDISCKYRFQDIIDKCNSGLDNILSIERDTEDRIVRIKCIKDKKYIIYKPKTVRNINIGKSLLELIRESYSEFTTVINMENGLYVKVETAPYKTGVISKILGYIKYDKRYKFSDEKREIYYWNKPIWIKVK